ncbi:MAG: sodium:proton antiporter [Myxococcota bacterium]
MMTEHLIFCGLLFIFLFSLVSRRATSSWLTAPIIFVAFGMLVGEGGLGWMNLDAQEPLLDPLAELTLILVLFGDASRIDLKALRKEAGLPARMLAFGMPLTILFGAAAASLMFPSLGMWEAAALAAILTPTDAALGQAVVSSEAVPLRIRQALNVESGLNDGIALPVVLVFTALAAAAGGAMSETSLEHWGSFWLMQVTIGPLAGAGFGYLGGQLIVACRNRGWISHSFERIGGLALALMAFFGAELLGGNGFMSAFVAGLVLGNTARDFSECVFDFLEAEGQLLMLLVFVMFGALLVAPTLERLTPMMVVYAALSLTVLRMVPVALSLIGSGAKRWSVVFLGWFGPRGLASILFGLIVLEEMAIVHRTQIFDVVILTVLLSVFAHGLTATWGARRYGRWVADQQDIMEHEMVYDHPTRHRMPDEDAA